MRTYSCANGQKWWFLPTSKCHLLSSEQNSLQQAVLPMARDWCVQLRVWLEGWMVFVMMGHTEDSWSSAAGPVQDRDKWQSWHCGGCVLAPRLPETAKALPEVGRPLPADPNSVGVTGSRRRDGHQIKNHPLLFPSVSYPLVVAFGLHLETQEYACTELTNRPAVQQLSLLKACTVNGNNR